jgi:hypothetical protein
MSRADFSAITELVPQISYDIIGRIIPGIIVIFSLIIATLGPTSALVHIDAWVIHPDPPLSGWAVVLFIVAGYTMAVILAGIRHFPGLFRRPRDERYEPNLENPSESLKYDAIRVKSPKAGAQHTKLSAEINQAGVLVVGWAISAAINLYPLIIGFSPDRFWLEIALVISIAGAYSFRKRICQSQRISLINHWLILQCAQLPTFMEDTTATSESSTD